MWSFLQVLLGIYWTVKDFIENPLFTILLLFYVFEVGKGVSEIVQNEAKEPEGWFLSMLLGRLGARLLGHLLTAKGVMEAGKEAIATC